MLHYHIAKNGRTNTAGMRERRVSRPSKHGRGSGAWERGDSLGKCVAPVHHGDGAENMRKRHGTARRDSSGKSKGRVFCRGVWGVREPARVRHTACTVKGNRDWLMDFFYGGRIRVMAEERADEMWETCSTDCYCQFHTLKSTRPVHFYRLLRKFGRQAKQESRSLLTQTPRAPALVPARINITNLQRNEPTFITYGHQPQVLRLFLSIGPVESSRLKNYSRISQTLEAIHPRVPTTPLRRQRPRRCRC